MATLHCTASGVDLDINALGKSSWGCQLFSMTFRLDGKPVLNDGAINRWDYERKLDKQNGIIIEDNADGETLVSFFERMAECTTDQMEVWRDYDYDDNTSSCAIAVYPHRNTPFKGPHEEQPHSFVIIASADIGKRNLHNAPDSCGCGAALVLYSGRHRLRRFAKRLRAEYEAKKDTCAFKDGKEESQ